MDFHPVKLYIYDISRGMARAMSQAILGKHIEGVWHTGIVVFGREYFFGGGGIESCSPGGTILGQPDSVHDLGLTQVNYTLYLDYLAALRTDTFSLEKYHLLDHNCNTFSNEVAQFLTGQTIPSYITSLPKEVMETPLGQMIKPMIDAMQVTPVGGEPIPHQQPAGQGSSASEGQGSSETAPVYRPPPVPDDGYDVYDRSAARAEAAALAAEYIGDKGFSALQTETEGFKRSNVDRAVLVLHEDVDVESRFTRLQNALPETLLSSDEMKTLQQLKDYILSDSKCKLDKPGADARGVLDIILTSPEVKPLDLVYLTDLLQAAALETDLREFFSNGHTLMRWFNTISLDESVPEELRLSITKFLCNMCLSRDGFDWLTSTVQWSLDSKNTSNSRIINRFLVNNLLSGYVSLCETSAACMLNLSQYKVYEDAAIEFGSALLQCLAGDLDENPAFYCLSALYQFTEYGEVACLTNVLGLDLGKYVNKSDRIRKVCSDINEVCKD
ncbi:uncharacterized protein [Ptychodera flava]|uniref:uncharacterized protein n=1 Tax=Ptychodera flava TaxID=63121 RepID=UPI00396A4BF0